MTMKDLQTLILASGSPRRAELIKEITEDFEVIPSGAEEITRPDRSPEENALDLAKLKAEDVARRHPGRWVLGADTIVVLEGQIIGKPVDEPDAKRILKRLSGQEHQVITAMALVNGQCFQEAVVSTVQIKSLSDQEIIDYIATGEPMDKAGAYAIQGTGSFMVESYRGSYSNIVGLPLESLRDLMAKAGFNTGSPQ